MSKYNKSSHIQRYRDTHRYREKKTSGYQWGEREEERQDRGRGLGGTNYYV